LDFNANAEGFKSFGFDILLYASLVSRCQCMLV